MNMDENDTPDRFKILPELEKHLIDEFLAVLNILNSFQKSSKINFSPHS